MMVVSVLIVQAGLSRLTHSLDLIARYAAELQKSIEIYTTLKKVSYMSVKVCLIVVFYDLTSPLSWGISQVLHLGWLFIKMKNKPFYLFFYTVYSMYV